MAAYIRWVRRLLPSPFSIAMILTVFSAFMVVAFNWIELGTPALPSVVNWWVNGLFEVPMLAFAVQMMLMLVLGHALALSPVFVRLIDMAVRRCHDTASSAAIVCTVAMVTGLFNWGLGLIVGAILARKVGEKFMAMNRPLNYGLIGAAGYAALMIWHGGISGSALIKVAEPGHLNDLISQRALAGTMPQFIGLDQTAFSFGNLLTCLLILVTVPLVLKWVGQQSWGESAVPKLSVGKPMNDDGPAIGAERIDQSNWAGRVFGSLILLAAITNAIYQEVGFFQFFVPNNINLLLLGAALIAHGRIHAFLSAIGSAIGGASSILIQFPLYFGIMGLVKSSGLIVAMSDFFVAHSTEVTLPLFTFLSAGAVNILVPSGGGQWVVQGPIVIEAAQRVGVDLPKIILALAYGDQITNMLQPFWALPLLGITQLSARKILPYTLIMFAVGFVIYGLSILVLL